MRRDWEEKGRGGEDWNVERRDVHASRTAPRLNAISGSLGAMAAADLREVGVRKATRGVSQILCRGQRDVWAVLEVL